MRNNMNKYILNYKQYLFLICIFFSNIIYSADENPFANNEYSIDYKEILKIKLKPEKTPNDDFKNGLESLRNWGKELLKLDKKRELKGYYAVLFINNKAMFFTKLERNGDIYTNRFATEEIDFNVSLSEVEENHLKGKVDIYYKYGNPGSQESDGFGCKGIIPLVENIFIFPIMDKNKVFAIYKL